MVMVSLQLSFAVDNNNVEYFYFQF